MISKNLKAKLTDDVNIVEFKPIVTPLQLKAELPQDQKTAEVVIEGRKNVSNIIKGNDSRMLAIVGPCSIHDKTATIEYAHKLHELQEQVKEKIVIVMRAYFEKPRTTLGWKGLIYDPYLDGSYDIQAGLRLSRSILLEISRIGLPAATEILDPIVPQYIADLISWASIGARTSESQIHRQMASGLSMPIGFKNATDGSLTVAVQAIKAAKNAHSFFGIDGNGRVVSAQTRGNKVAHFVMRGGSSEPNYASEHIAYAEVLLRKAGLKNGIIVDCSHANSSKDYRLQKVVLDDIIQQKKDGNKSIVGVMIESFLKSGNQPVEGTNGKREYGQSVTDQCIGWEETETMILQMADTLGSFRI